MSDGQSRLSRHTTIHELHLEAPKWFPRLNVPTAATQAAYFAMHTAFHPSSATSTAAFSTTFTGSTDTKHHQESCGQARCLNPIELVPSPVFEPDRIGTKPGVFHPRFARVGHALRETSLRWGLRRRLFKSNGSKTH
jgi:hypothetical protein